MRYTVGTCALDAIYSFEEKTEIGAVDITLFTRNHLERSVAGLVAIRVRTVFVHLSDLFQDRHLMIMLRFRCLLVRDVGAAGSHQTEECHQPWRHLKSKR